MILPPHGERVLSSYTVPERRESRIITVHNKSDAMEHIPFTVQYMYWDANTYMYIFPLHRETNSSHILNACVCLFTNTRPVDTRTCLNGGEADVVSLTVSDHTAKSLPVVTGTF